VNPRKSSIGEPPAMTVGFSNECVPPCCDFETTMLQSVCDTTRTPSGDALVSAFPAGLCGDVGAVRSERGLRSRTSFLL